MIVKGIGTRGLASGKVFLKRASVMPAGPLSNVSETGACHASESEAFSDALRSVRSDLEYLAESSDVFAAHLEMLDDPMLSDTVTEFIAEGMTALQAVQAASEQICGMFSQIDDEYLSARVDDVRDVCGRIGTKLSGCSFSWDEMSSGAVVVADELLPSDTADMDLGKVSAFVTRKGSRTSHVCIIASNNAIPAVVGADISEISEGDVLLVDADAGEIVVNPSASQIREFELRLDTYENDRRSAGEHSFSSAVTADGRTVPVFANAGSVDEVRRAIASGADGIGLFRTEFVFMNSSVLPSEDVQYGIYREAAVACEGKPLTVRTLDVGGDKMLPYLPMQEEENPFLGLRGIRFCLAHEDIFRTQLRAILRASASGKLRIMFPMVDTESELLQARSILEECKDELRSEGLAFDPDIETGIMVETPSAVIMADRLASECSFFSIGTNDLTQYIMAADRGNAAVSYLCEALSQPVVRAVAMTLDAAHRCGKPVAMCGEMASDPDATELLLSLDLDVFSVAAPYVSGLKERIRKYRKVQ